LITIAVNSDLYIVQIIHLFQNFTLYFFDTQINSLSANEHIFIIIITSRTFSNAPGPGSVKEVSQSEETAMEQGEPSSIDVKDVVQDLTKTFYANNSWYCFLHLFTVLSTRVRHFKMHAQQMTDEEKYWSTFRSVDSANALATRLASISK